MEKTLTLEELTQVHMILDKLGNFDSEKLPVSFFYQVSKILGKIQPEYEFFEKKKKELIEKYAEKDEKGEIRIVANDNVKILPENQKEFIEKFEELLKINVVLEYKPIYIQLSYTLPLNAKEILALDDILKFEGEQ